METKKRKAARSQREQLKTLVNGWDPVGRLAAGAPRNEYDWIVDDLLGLLKRKATKEEVSEFLDSQMAGHFEAKPKGVRQFANKALAWFRLASA